MQLTLILTFILVIISRLIGSLVASERSVGRSIWFAVQLIRCIAAFFSQYDDIKIEWERLTLVDCRIVEQQNAKIITYCAGSSMTAKEFHFVRSSNLFITILFRSLSLSLCIYSDFSRLLLHCHHRIYTRIDLYTVSTRRLMKPIAFPWAAKQQELSLFLLIILIIKIYRYAFSTVCTKKIMSTHYLRICAEVSLCTPDQRNGTN